LVKQPGDGWKVLAILTLTNTAVLMVGYFWMYQKVELLPLRLRPSIVMLRKGANLFVQRGTNNLVATLQLAILSTLVSPTYLGTFVGANRLYRVALDLFTPIGQVFVPRLSYLLVNQPRQAYKLNIIGSGMVISFGGCLGIFAYYQADWIVIALLGPEYANSTSVLHILGFALFLYGLDFVLALHWMVPLGLDRSYMAVSLGAGVINLALTILLVPTLGVQGAAWSLTLVELLVVVAQSVVVYRHRLRWLTSVANKP
jgi:PST family polysaccharide transporter